MDTIREALKKRTLGLPAEARRPQELPPHSLLGARSKSTFPPLVTRATNGPFTFLKTRCIPGNALTKASAI